MENPLCTLTEDRTPGKRSGSRPERTSFKSVKTERLVTVSLTTLFRYFELRTYVTRWFLRAPQWPCHDLGRSPRTLYHRTHLGVQSENNHGLWTRAQYWILVPSPPESTSSKEGFASQCSRRREFEGSQQRVCVGAHLGARKDKSPPQLHETTCEGSQNTAPAKWVNGA